MRLSAQVWFLAAYLSLSGALPVSAQQKPAADSPPTIAASQQSPAPTTSIVMNSPDDDHISCELTEASLLQLRPREEYPNLNEMEGEQLFGQVVQAVSKVMNQDNSRQTEDFLKKLDELRPLTGLTRAQAQNRILQKIAEFALSLPSPSQKVPIDDPEYKSFQMKVVPLDDNQLDGLGIQSTANKLKNNIPVTVGDLASLKKAVTSLQERDNELQFAISVYHDAAQDPARYKSRYSYPNEYANLVRADQEYQARRDTHKEWDVALKTACGTDKRDQGLACAAKYQLKADQLRQLLNPLDIPARDLSQSPFDRLNSSIFNIQDIATAAHKAITAFAKPDDVGCAMTILPWNNMRYTFGQKVADEFLGVQITVRNLNAEKEYLLHGADFAVDMDLSDAKPLHSRFFSGVDKQNVRAYMLAARDYDPRSLFVHSAEGLSTLLGSVAPIWGGVVTDASSVFAGGFLPALTHVWTDSHTEQLNQLNDVGFSASRNDRTFVPKSGSTQFVIFVPVRPLEQAWWTQKCVEAIPLGRGGPLSSPTGIDIEASRRICYDQLTRNPTINFPTPGTMTLPTSGHPTADPIPASLTYFVPAKINYRKWTPTTYALLKELSFAIIAGTHVTLSSDTHPDITQVDCPHTGVGDLDFSAAKSGVLTCSLSGVNLDKVDHVTLRAATDTQTVDSPLKAANGGKVATVDLKVSDLCPLQKTAYNLYTVTSNGIEDGGTQAIHLSQEPFLTQAPTPSALTTNPATVSPSSVTTNPFTLKLTGCHLDDLQSIKLGDGAPKTPPLVASLQDAASASIVVGDPTDKTLFSKWPNATKDSSTVSLSIYLISNTDQSHPQDSKQTLSVTIPPAK